jgi:hypothetical protein
VSSNGGKAGRPAGNLGVPEYRNKVKSTGPDGGHAPQGAFRTRALYDRSLSVCWRATVGLPVAEMAFRIEKLAAGKRCLDLLPD